MANKTTRLLNTLKRQPEPKAPIATEMFLPNHSGIATHPESKKTFVKVAGDTMTGDLEMNNASFAVSPNSSTTEPTAILRDQALLLFDDAARGSTAPTLTQIDKTTFLYKHVENTGNQTIAEFYSTGRASGVTADNNEAYYKFYMQEEDTQTDVEYARMTIIANDALKSSEDGQIKFSVVSAGSMTDSITIVATGVKHADDIKDFYGTSNDFRIYCDGTDLIFDRVVGSGIFSFTDTNIETKKTGAPSGVYCDRTDGAIGGLVAGSTAVNFRYDSSKAFKVQLQPRADLQSQNGSNITEVMQIDASGNFKFSHSAQWTANGTNTVTISNVAPSGVGTATINKWLTVQDNNGNTFYIPVWT